MNENTDFSFEATNRNQVLTPKRVLDLYYLDVRWHLLEIAAMLDRAQRGAAAHPEDASFSASNAGSGSNSASNSGSNSGDLRAELLREAISLLALDSAEPNRTERLLTLFTKMDPKERAAIEGSV